MNQVRRIGNRLQRHFGAAIRAAGLALAGRLAFIAAAGAGAAAKLFRGRIYGKGIGVFHLFHQLFMELERLPSGDRPCKINSACASDRRKS